MRLGSQGPRCPSSPAPPGGHYRTLAARSLDLDPGTAWQAGGQQPAADWEGLQESEPGSSLLPFNSGDAHKSTRMGRPLVSQAVRVRPRCGAAGL